MPFSTEQLTTMVQTDGTTVGYGTNVTVPEN